MSRPTTHHATWRRRRWVIGSVALTLIAVFGLTNGSSLVRVVRALSAVDGRLLLVGVALSIAAVVNRGLLNQAAHQSVGLAATPIDMIRTAAVGFTAHKVVRSGGASGLAVFVHHGRRRGFAAGSVGAACLVAAFASFAALGVLLTGTLATLAISGRLTGWWIAAGVGFAVYAMIIGLVIFVITRSRVAANRWWSRAQRARRRLSFGRGDAEPGHGTVVDDVFDALAVAKTQSGARHRVMLHALVGKLLGASMLLASAMAAGLFISLSTALIIYATALGSSMVSIVPGGVGVVEVSTVAMLVGSGASAGAATLAVAVFRLFDLWIPVAAGAFASRRELMSPALPDSTVAESVVDPRVPGRQLALAS